MLELQKKVNKRISSAFFGLRRNLIIVILYSQEAYLSFVEYKDQVEEEEGGGGEVEVDEE